VTFYPRDYCQLEIVTLPNVAIRCIAQGKALGNQLRTSQWQNSTLLLVDALLITALLQEVKFAKRVDEVPAAVPTELEAGDVGGWTKCPDTVTAKVFAIFPVQFRN
jgi:hypothetical protein